MGIETQIGLPTIATRPALRSPLTKIGPELSLRPPSSFSLDTIKPPTSPAGMSLAETLRATAPIGLSRPPQLLDRVSPSLQTSPNFGLELTPLKPVEPFIDRVVPKSESLEILRSAKSLIESGIYTREQAGTKIQTIIVEQLPEIQEIKTPEAVIASPSTPLRVNLSDESPESNSGHPRESEDLDSPFQGNDMEEDSRVALRAPRNDAELVSTPQLVTRVPSISDLVLESEVKQILVVKEALEKTNLPQEEQDQILIKALEDKIPDPKIRERVQTQIRTPRPNLGELKVDPEEDEEEKRKRLIIERDEKANSARLIKGKKAIEIKFQEREVVYSAEILEEMGEVGRDENSEANKESDGSVRMGRKEFAKAGKFYSPDQAWKALTESFLAHTGVRIVEQPKSRSASWKNLEEVLYGQKWTRADLKLIEVDTQLILS